MDDSGLHEGFDWENAEDVTALSEEDLRDALGALSEEERHLGYRRTILQGRMDLMRAELVERVPLRSLPSAWRGCCSAIRLTRSRSEGVSVWGRSLGGDEVLCTECGTRLDAGQSTVSTRRVSARTSSQAHPAAPKGPP